MKNLKEIKEELLQDEKFRHEYHRLDKDFDIAQEVMRVRITHGFTQEELAEKIGTKQPSIARLESGNHTPSLKILRAIEDALGISLTIKFDLVKDISFLQNDAVSANKLISNRPIFISTNSER